MMTRNMRFILPLIVCAACSDLSLVRYEIPDGYVGRVVIEYGKPDCLSERSGIPRVIVISKSGRGCSKKQTSPKTTWSKFYYVDRSGRRVRELHSTRWGGGGYIWAEAGSADGHTHEFFVGSEEQFKAASQDRRPANKRSG